MVIRTHRNRTLRQDVYAGFPHPFNRLDKTLLAIAARLDLRCRRPELKNRPDHSRRF